MVLAAGDGESPQAAAALERLCQTYWPPVHAFVRRQTPNSAEAADLAQGFFAQLLARKSLSHAAPERGRFRSFLLASLKNFLADEHARAHALKRGGATTILPLEAPSDENTFEPSHAASPDALFDRRWALHQLERALARLADEYRAAGRSPLFDLLQDYVWGEKNGATLAEIAARLDLTEEAVKKAVQRLRHRFRDCLRAEIAETVGSPDLIDQELRHLRAALAPA